ASLCDLADGGDRWRERFAIRPDGAVGEELLLPDGHGLLQSVDEPAARLEGWRAMRGIDRDQYARFPDLEPSQPVDDGDIANGELLPRFGREPLHLRERHRFVGVVFEIFRLATA